LTWQKLPVSLIGLQEFREMRLFVAVDIDDRTRAQLAQTRAALQAILDQARVPPRITWVKDASAHVTLRFIGEAPETAAANIQRALTSPWPTPPFDVQWEYLGAFPTPRRPRVLWVGPESATLLVRLADAVNQKLQRLLGPGEDRPFAPHLTLGRVKESGIGVQWERALETCPWETTTTRIDHVTLYVSRLSPKGATYTALCQAPL
jgi:2'-5' RNA ligase